MPAGLLATLPLPVPVVATERTKEGALTVVLALPQLASGQLRLLGGSEGVPPAAGPTVAIFVIVRAVDGAVAVITIEAFSLSSKALNNGTVQVRIAPELFKFVQLNELASTPAPADTAVAITSAGRRSLIVAVVAEAV